MKSIAPKAFRSTLVYLIPPFCILAISLGTEGAASAQDDSNSVDTAAARSLAVDGMKLADAGKCQEAIDKLARAEKLHHAPIVLGRLGECQIAVGKIVDGTENLRKVVREPLPSSPSPAVMKARDRAQSSLDAAKSKIAALTISIKGSNNATVTVDGQPVPSALLDADRPTDPGDHVVEATAPGFLKASSRVALAMGEKLGVTLKLESDPNAARATLPSPILEADSSPGSRTILTHDTDSTVRAETSSSSSASTPNHTAAYVLWGVGAAGFAVGATFGVLALTGKQSLDKECPQSVCQPRSQDNLDTARSFGNVSTAGFVVAGAGVVLGTVLYVSAGSSSKSSAQDRPILHEASRFRARAFVGLSHAGIAAEF
jgi:hypothetical protein